MSGSVGQGSAALAPADSARQNGDMTEFAPPLENPAQPVLQRHTPYDPAALKPLPGIAPMHPDEWLLVDEAFAAQMALRDGLLAQRSNDVVAMLPAAAAAADELLARVLEYLSGQPAYRVADHQVIRPDGAEVAIDRARPMQCLTRLVQEDLCIMEKPAGQSEHILSAASLCFPAAWLLAEKIGRPMLHIHHTVPDYDPNTAKRVQRLLDGVQPGRPLWRFNGHAHVDPRLFNPQSIHDKRPYPEQETERWWRTERQTLTRLPDSGAVVFSIHTYMLDRRAMTGPLALD